MLSAELQERVRAWREANGLTARRRLGLGVYVQGFKSLDEAKQFRKEHGGMVLDSHKKSKTKARYGQRMREVGLDRTLYPYAVEFVER